MSLVKEHQVALPGLLQRSLERGRLAHAYLFTGGQLGALEEVAQELTLTLNCTQPQRRFASGFAAEPCRGCDVCRRIQRGEHPDVYWLRPESKLRVITIQQIRELMQGIHLKPLEAVYKVAVIVAADRLNEQSANAFLKTLEEPPEKSLMLLLSTDPSRVMETILSRCLRLACGVSGGGGCPGAARGFLKEFVTAVPDRVAKGLLGKYQLLGVLQRHLASMRDEIERELSARSPLARYEDIEPRQREQWQEELVAAVEAEYRRRRAELLQGLQSWLRDVWLTADGQAADLFEFPDWQEITEAVARRLRPEAARENLLELERTQRLLQTNVQEALTLEVGLLRLRL